MLHFLIPFHVTFATITVGIVFLQSLLLVMALRLTTEEQQHGVRTLQARIQLMVFYPVVGIALMTGLINSQILDSFNNGKWLHWKLLIFMVLVGLGLYVGSLIHKKQLNKGLVLVVHVLVFVTSYSIIYMAVVKPF